ncbi:MAG: peptidylprolyl isomerase [Alphaproteobacteria bacterium]|nr:MAG: peptidylprolyl isomerase [Alphaproteobacteria bacterium]
MMIQAPSIEINGIKITPDEINTEVQYHAAESLFSAKYEAMRALVIREILIQRASEIGLCQRNEAIKNPDPIIEDLLAREVTVPNADKETCKRYYENNKDRFYTSPLFEVSHILYIAPPDDEGARTEALLKAKTALIRLKESPQLFKAIARNESSCSSAKNWGRLGQISRGQTMPAFEKALFSMKEGELSAEPVASEVGYHIIKVHKCVQGKQLPFGNVSEWIARELHEKSWRRAFHQYIQLLAGRCKISGFRLEGIHTPLVQ